MFVLCKNLLCVRDLLFFETSSQRKVIQKKSCLLGVSPQSPPKNFLKRSLKRFARKSFGNLKNFYKNKLSSPPFFLAKFLGRFGTRFFQKGVPRKNSKGALSFGVFIIIRCGSLRRDQRSRSRERAVSRGAFRRTSLRPAQRARRRERPLPAGYNRKPSS